MKIFIAIAFVLAALNAAASDSFQASVQAAAPTHPALYSFADVYRLTVSGGSTSVSSGAASVSRVAVTQPPAPEMQFSIGGLPQQERWVLVLAGLALALWVARRRLGYFF